MKAKRRQSEPAKQKVGTTKKNPKKGGLVDLVDGRTRRGLFLARKIEKLPTKDFKSLIRLLFEEPSGRHQVKKAKQRLAEVALKKALKGDFFFWSKLVSLHESELVTEDDLADFIERIYSIVRRNVESLDGGRDALAQIAKDLQKERFDQ